MFFCKLCYDEVVRIRNEDILIIRIYKLPKMGCGDSKGVPEAPESKGIMRQPETIEQRHEAEELSTKLHLYGDWFSSDSRAVYAILKHTNVDFEFILKNSLEGENM